MRALGLTLMAALSVGACASNPPEPKSESAAVTAPAEAEAPPAPPPSKPLGLDPQKIGAVVNSKASEVQGCHALAYAGSGGKGELAVDFTIAPNGTVEQSTIARSSFGNVDFEECVLGVINGLSFPASNGQTDASKLFRFGGGLD